MPFFTNDTSRYLYFACLIGFFCLIYALQSAQTPPSVEIAPHSVAHRLQNYYHQFAGLVTNTTRHYLNILGIKEELRAVKIENDILKAQLKALKELELENARILALLDYKQKLPNYEFVLGKVIAKDIISDHFSLFVDRGSNDGISKLSGVISPHGVVGYVTEVTETSAKILLLTDRLSSIDAVIQRTRARGIISGHSKALTRLKYIERPEDMAEGDLVVTSPDQEIFPPGFPIGKISTVNSRLSGVGHQASVKPAAQLKKLEEVIILKVKQ